jgi:hypothetical protein
MSTAREIVRKYAPDAMPWDYVERREWDESDLARYDALADVLDARTPTTDPDKDEALIGFRALLRDAATTEQDRRERLHYRTWIDDTARALAAEMAEQHVERDDGEDALFEYVDGAVPVYYSTVRRVFDECELNIDGETTALAGEDADHDRLMMVAVFQALESATSDALREVYDAREDDAA